MPRVSIRRFCLYALYTLIGASLVMLAFHVQQQQNVAVWLKNASEWQVRRLTKTKNYKYQIIIIK